MPWWNYCEVSVCCSETHHSEVFNVCLIPEKTPGAHLDLDIQICINVSKTARNSFWVCNYEADWSNFPQYVTTAHDGSSSVLFWISFDPCETVGPRRRQLELVICIQLHTQQQKGAQSREHQGSYFLLVACEVACARVRVLICVAKRQSSFASPWACLCPWMPVEMF